MAAKVTRMIPLVCPHCQNDNTDLMEPQGYRPVIFCLQCAKEFPMPLPPQAKV